jgi:hypothetical protein
VRPVSSIRFALALPIGSPRAIIAANQVVIYFVRDIGKTELDLTHRGPRPAQRSMRSRVGMVLFAAVTAERPPDDADDAARLEHRTRERVERYYARQGIVPVYYDLQVLASR